jgi:hypothetical protein
VPLEWRRLSARRPHPLPWLTRAAIAARPRSQAALSLQDFLPLADALLCRPAVTLAAGAALRPSLLRLVGCLIERRLQAGTHDAAFSVALLRLLSLAPHLKP